MSYNVPDPQIVLKVTPPRLPRTTQFRERLSFNGSAFRDRAVVEINAPAGFGKTTLLGQWRREALNEGNFVAWLTLDEHDNGLRFVQGIAYAMRLASGRPGFDRIFAQSESGDKAALEGLTAWLAEVTLLGAKTVLILDEVQSVPVSMLQESLLYLLLNVPSNLHVILASRRWLALQIPDMVARGLYANVGVEQIRLTQAETTALLGVRFDARINPDDCVRLHEKIAGWPLGLQLAVASIEKKSNLSASIDALASVTSNFEQYFLAKFLSGLDESTIEFLQDISVLDALTPALCGAVTGRSDAVALIEDLSKTLPIFVESTESEWIRLHPMALEYFRTQATARSPDVARVLHERAAHWFAGRQMIEEAAIHELAAGNTGYAHELIGERLYDIMIGGHQIRVLDWLERIPALEIERNPRVLLAAAWALGESERNIEVETLIQKLESHPSATEADRFEGMVIRCAAAYFADRPDTAATILSTRNSSPPNASPLLNAIFANAKSTLLLLEGKPEQARQFIRMSYAQWPKGVDAVRCWGEWVTGFSYLWEGQVQLAIESLQESLLRCEEALGRRAALSVIFASTLSEALVDAGRLDEAAAVLADRLDVIERLAAPQSIAMGYKSAARVALATGHQRRAFDLLEYLYALGESRQIPRFCITSLSEQTQIHALQGHKETCISTYKRLEAIIATYGDAPEGILYPLLKLRASIAEAYAGLALQDWRAMLSALEPARVEADRIRRGRERIDILLLTALAHYKLVEGNPNLLVAEAKSLAEIYGYKATLVDTSPELFGWLDAWQGRETAVPAPMPREKPEASQPRQLVRASGLLTAKEQEILQLLEKNLTNKQIAAALGASKDTVKWHIRNLFTKLDAGSRKHSVDRARMLGILPDL